MADRLTLGIPTHKLWHIGKEGDRPKDIGKWISVFISIRFEAKEWGFSKLDSLFTFNS